MNDERRLCILIGPGLDGEPRNTSLCGKKVGSWWDHRHDRSEWAEAVFEHAGEAVERGIERDDLRACPVCLDDAIKGLEKLR